MNLSLSPAPDKLTDLESEKVKDILVVRQHNQIGDMLCSLTVICGIEKKISRLKNHSRCCKNQL